VRKIRPALAEVLRALPALLAEFSVACWNLCWSARTESPRTMVFFFSSTVSSSPDFCLRKVGEEVFVLESVDLDENLDFESSVANF